MMLFTKKYIIVYLFAGLCSYIFIYYIDLLFGAQIKLILQTMKYYLNSPFVGIALISMLLTVIYDNTIKINELTASFIKELKTMVILSLRFNKIMSLDKLVVLNQQGFYQAVKNGNTLLAKSLIKELPYLPLLYQEIRKKNYDVVEALVSFFGKKKLDNLGYDHYLKKSLLIASEQQDFLMVKLLLEYGAKNMASTLGYFPLHLAVANKNIPIVELLINHFKKDDIINQQTTVQNHEKTALIIAIEHNDEEMVNFLLAHGAKNIPIKTSNFYPIHIASIQRNVKITKILLDTFGNDTINAIGNPHTPDSFGSREFAKNTHKYVLAQTPLMLVMTSDISKPSLALIELLLTRGSLNIPGKFFTSLKPVFPIHVAISLGDPDLVRLLLMRFPETCQILNDVFYLRCDEQNTYHCTLLIFSIINPSKHTRTIVELLLAYGATNQNDSEGFSPLFHSLLHEEYDVSELLLTHFAKQQFKEKNLAGDTQIIAAVKKIKKNLDSKEIRSVLQNQFIAKYLMAINYLLNHGAQSKDISDIQDINGDTALFYLLAIFDNLANKTSSIIRQNYVNIIVTLIKNHCDVVCIKNNIDISAFIVCHQNVTTLYIAYKILDRYDLINDLLKTFLLVSSYPQDFLSNKRYSIYAIYSMVSVMIVQENTATFSSDLIKSTDITEVNNYLQRRGNNLSIGSAQQIILGNNTTFYIQDGNKNFFDLMTIYESQVYSEIQVSFVNTLEFYIEKYLLVYANVILSRDEIEGVCIYFPLSSVIQYFKEFDTVFLPDKNVKSPWIHIGDFLEKINNTYSICYSNISDNIVGIISELTNMASSSTSDPARKNYFNELYAKLALIYIHHMYLIPAHFINALELADSRVQHCANNLEADFFIAFIKDNPGHYFNFPKRFRTILDIDLLFEDSGMGKKRTAKEVSDILISGYDKHETLYFKQRIFNHVNKKIANGEYPAEERQHFLIYFPEHQADLCTTMVLAQLEQLIGKHNGYQEELDIFYTPKAPSYLPRSMASRNRSIDDDGGGVSESKHGELEHACRHESVHLTAHG